MQGRQIMFTDVGKVETQEYEFVPPAELFRDDMILKTEYTLISPGTEMDGLMGRLGKSYPKLLGYSAVCRVVQCGAEVTGFQPGDRVLVYHSKHRSWQLKNKRDVVKVPEGIDPVEAVFAVVGCMGFQGVRKVRPELGESVMVMGLGLLGQIALQCAALSGGFPVIGIDFNPFRRNIALAHGADYAFSPDEPGLIEKVREITTRDFARHEFIKAGLKPLPANGVNAVVEVSGNPEAVKQGLKMMACLGRIALVGCSRTPTGQIDFYRDVHRPGIQIIRAHNYARPVDDSYPGYWTMREDMALLMALIRAGKLNTRCLLSTVETPENAQRVYNRFIEKDPEMLGAVFDWTKE